jgi:hypothetical protein
LEQISLDECLLNSSSFKDLNAHTIRMMSINSSDYF